MIWGILTWLLLQTVGGTTYIIRLEGHVDRNTVAVEHVKELQDQQNDHTAESLKRIEKKQEDIERLLRENLKKETRDVR
jgi:tRNA A58 N-methylase Trm61